MLDGGSLKKYKMIAGEKMNLENFSFTIFPGISQISTRQGTSCIESYLLCLDASKITKYHYIFVHPKHKHHALSFVSFSVSEGDVIHNFVPQRPHIHSHMVK